MLSATSCQHLNDYLIKIYKGSIDEVGVPCGYVNERGDTVIPFGIYDYYYTDTFRKMAIVLKKNGELVGINRKFHELFNVYWYDNGPDYVADGLFRIRKNGKIGYANSDGKIMIQPQFDCAFPFEHRKAKVSIHCLNTSEVENTLWKSDNWYFIDIHGKKFEKLIIN